jgi:hypothetical protein
MDMSRSEIKNAKNPDQKDRINKLQDELRDLSDGNFQYNAPPDVSPDVMESHLEDIRSFEALGSGPSLFEGLEQNGVRLPSPDKLNEFLSIRKVNEIFRALGKIGVYLFGFEEMTPCELYSKLWHETLWEGCYVKKRTPGAVTLIDVSHAMTRSELNECMERLMQPARIH